MFLIMLRPKVPAKATEAKGMQAQEAVRIVLQRVKLMTLFKTTEKVVNEARKLVEEGVLKAKQHHRVASLIRIQIEEVKRKVRSLSPAALQFIGPGDYVQTPPRKGGNFSILPQN